MHCLPKVLDKWTPIEHYLGQAEHTFKKDADKECRDLRSVSQASNIMYRVEKVAAPCRERLTTNTRRGGRATRYLTSGYLLRVRGGRLSHPTLSSLETVCSSDCGG